MIAAVQQAEGDGRLETDCAGVAVVLVRRGGFKRWFRESGERGGVVEEEAGVSTMAVALKSSGGGGGPQSVLCVSVRAQDAEASDPTLQEEATR